MPEGAHVAQLRHPIGQQAQCPARHALWRITARSTVSQASTSPVNLGGTPDHSLPQRPSYNPPCKKRWRTFRTATLLYKNASATSWPVRFWPCCDRLEEKQDTRSGVGAGRDLAGANQLLKFRPLFVRRSVQHNIYMYVYPYNCTT